MAGRISPNRVGTIRRVIRRGDDFMCGLCRSSFPHYQHAQHCLNECWKEFSRLPPVVQRGWLGSRWYRCRYCARDFDNLADAVGCAAECRAKATARKKVEDATNVELTGLEPRKPALRPAVPFMALPRLLPRPLTRRKNSAPVPSPAQKPKTVELAEPVNADVTPSGRNTPPAGEPMIVPQTVVSGQPDTLDPGGNFGDTGTLDTGMVDTGSNPVSSAS